MFGIKQKGVSLIELMIGMTIGLAIMAISYQIFIGNKTTHNRILAQSRLQENARFAFHFVGKTLRNAGYRPIEEELPDIKFSDANNPIISGSDGTDLPTPGEPAPLSFSTRSASVTFGTETLSLANVATYSDVLVVRYLGATEAGPVTDCLGEAVIGGVLETDDQGTEADASDDVNYETLLAADIFYVRIAPNQEDNRSRFRLHCRTERLIQEAGGTPQRVSSGGQTLVEDVTAFQVRLGVDTNGDEVVDVYQTFADNPELNRVRSIEVTLDVKGGRTLDLIQLVEAQTLSASESMQQQFSQTIALRNLTR